jgi:hypothetical protein
LVFGCYVCLFVEDVHVYVVYRKREREIEKIKGEEQRL